ERKLARDIQACLRERAAYRVGGIPVGGCDGVSIFARRSGRAAAAWRGARAAAIGPLAVPTLHGTAHYVVRHGAGRSAGSRGADSRRVSNRGKDGYQPDSLRHRANRRSRNWPVFTPNGGRAACGAALCQHHGRPAPAHLSTLYLRAADGAGADYLYSGAEPRSSAQGRADSLILPEPARGVLPIFPPHWARKPPCCGSAYLSRQFRRKSGPVISERQGEIKSCDVTHGNSPGSS